MEFKAVKINKPEAANVIVGQSHFIKTVEDIYEALMASSSMTPAFSSASRSCPTCLSA